MQRKGSNYGEKLSAISRMKAGEGEVRRMAAADNFPEEWVAVAKRVFDKVVGDESLWNEELADDFTGLLISRKLIRRDPTRFQQSGYLSFYWLHELNRIMELGDKGMIARELPGLISAIDSGLDSLHSRSEKNFAIVTRLTAVYRFADSQYALQDMATFEANEPDFTNRDERYLWLKCTVLKRDRQYAACSQVLRSLVKIGNKEDLKVDGVNLKIFPNAYAMIVELRLNDRRASFSTADYSSLNNYINLAIAWDDRNFTQSAYPHEIKARLEKKAYEELGDRSYATKARTSAQRALELNPTNRVAREVLNSV